MGRRESAAPLRERFSLRQALKHWRIAAIVAIAVAAAGAYRPITSSGFFALEKIEVQGNERVPASEIEATVRRLMGTNIFHHDLASVRGTLKQRPIIKDATVTRLLPDTVRVSLVERTPVAVVARSGKLVCVDEDGVTLGDYTLMGEQPGPTMLGWAESGTPLKIAENRQRIQRYLGLQQELSAKDSSEWNQIDQIDLSDRKDVVISLVRRPMTWIRLGDRDFHDRFVLSQTVLKAVEGRNREELQRLGIAVSDEQLQEGLKISFMDVSRPPRVVVRLPSATAGQEKNAKERAPRR
jgi:cell division protein FtsQ